MVSKAHSQLKTAKTFPLVPQVLADTTHTALAQQSLQEGVLEYLRSTSCQRYLSQVGPGCCCAVMPGSAHVCAWTSPHMLLLSLQLHLYFSRSASLRPVAEHNTMVQGHMACMDAWEPLHHGALACYLACPALLLDGRHRAGVQILRQHATLALPAGQQAGLCQLLGQHAAPAMRALLLKRSISDTDSCDMLQSWPADSCMLCQTKSCRTANASLRLLHHWGGD